VDSSRGESVCQDCGYIVDDTHIDHGPEWREFDAKEQSKRRTGPSRDPTRHDFGLGTDLKQGFKDGYGNTLSAGTRKKFARLKKRQSREKRNDKDRRVIRGFTEINRMHSALGLSDPVETGACNLFRQCCNDGLLPGHSIEGMATAALYLAHRINDGGLSIPRIVAVSQIEEQHMIQCSKTLRDALNIPLEPPKPLDFFPRIASEVGIAESHRLQAKDLIQDLDGEEHAGLNPRGVAAAAIYVTDRSHTLKQACIAESADVTPRTVRNTVRNLFDKEETANYVGSTSSEGAT
jgi:transcription initiation factor TFIIB